MTNKELAHLISEVEAELSNQYFNPALVRRIVEPLRRAGIVAKCHIGQGDLMRDEKDPVSVKLKLEWYAGQLLDIVDTNAWHCMDTWLNCVYKFGRE